MERLTKRHDDGNIHVKDWHIAYDENNGDKSPMCRAVIRLAEYEDLGATPQELKRNLLDAAIKDKEYNKITSRYIDLLKQCAGDPCSECKNYVKCDSSCPSFTEGFGAHTGTGQYVGVRWSCMDFDKCPRITETPCFECKTLGFVGFSLKE